MNLLLDTHVFLWWDSKAPELQPGARSLIRDPNNAVYVSAASVMEIAIKRRSGKLAFTGSVRDAIVRSEFLALAIEADDAEDAGALDWDHRDPFDHLLVAQALRRSLVFLTVDAAIRRGGPDLGLACV